MSRYEEDDDIRTALLNMYGLGRQMTPRPKKEMTTRELLEQQLAGYDDDMEPRTPMPDPELEFDGNELYVKETTSARPRGRQWPGNPDTKTEQALPFPITDRLRKDFIT